MKHLSIVQDSVHGTSYLLVGNSNSLIAICAQACDFQRMFGTINCSALFCASLSCFGDETDYVLGLQTPSFVHALQSKSDIQEQG